MVDCDNVGDPLWAARAAGPLASVVRETGRPRHAFEVCVASAHRIAGANPLDGAPEYLAVYGTLLLHAALTAAASGEKVTAAELLTQARAAAAETSRDYHRTHFGHALVNVVEVATAVELGRGADVVNGLDAFVDDPGHRRLPVAVRAGHLVESARAYLQAGDATTAAGRARAGGGGPYSSGRCASPPSGA